MVCIRKRTAVVLLVASVVILTGVGAYFLINARSLKERIGIIGDTESIFIRAIVSENAQHIAWMKMDFISYSLPTIDGVSYYYYDYDEDVYLGSDDLYPGTFIFSPDGERYAFVLGEYGEMRVVWDGEKGEIYCCLSKPVFSPDSQHIAYFGKKSYDSDRVLVLDGKEIQSRYWRKSRILFPSEQPIVFSEDSEELAFESYDLRKDRLIRVGVRDGRVKRINIKGGCRDFFYDRNELCWLVIEDNYVCLRSKDALTYKEPRYGKVGNVTYTKDKMRFAYVSEDENGKQSVVYQEMAGKPYDKIDKLSFSPNGKHLAYLAQKNGKQCLVFDGEEGKWYDTPSYNFLAFSPDSKHLAYKAKEGDEYFVVIDEKEGKRYDGLSSIVFSPDSKHLTFRAFINKKIEDWDGEKVETFEATVVLDGKEGKVYYDVISPPFFSPDSKHIFYVAEKMYHTFDWFSPDWDMKQFIVIDGKEGKKWDRVINGRGIDKSEIGIKWKDNELRYFAASGEFRYDIYRVVANAPN